MSSWPVSSGQGVDQPEDTGSCLRHRKITKSSVTEFFNYSALGKKLANEHLLLSIHPVYESNPKIAEKIDNLYSGVEGMLKAVEGIVRLQGKMAKHELGMVWGIHCNLTSGIAHMEQIYHIETIPALREVSAKVDERMAVLLKQEKIRLGLDHE
jgi:hypothetical protein